MGCTVSFEKQSKDFVSENEIPHVYQKQYRTGTVLGKGASGIVRLAINKKTGRKYAVKIVDRSKLDVKDDGDLRREVEIMKACNHPHIVKFVDFFEDKKFFYIILELMRGGHLFRRISKKTKYTEKEARDVVINIASALKYCHDRDIVHRDLKPQNLLMESEDDDATLKITDFGFAKFDSQNLLETSLGTPAYIAPEILLGQHYGKPVDMWSFGVITFFLISGYLPFEDDSSKALFKKIKSGDYTFNPKHWSNVSEDAKNFIRGLLQVDPEKRLTADQVLSHSWLQHDDDVLAGNNLRTSLEEFQKFRGIVQFRAAAKAIIAVNRLTRMSHENSHETNTGDNDSNDSKHSNDLKKVDGDDAFADNHELHSEMILLTEE